MFIICLRQISNCDVCLSQVVLGKTIERPAVVDTTLVEELANCGLNSDNFKTVKGTTLCADDFYEGNSNICTHLPTL